MCIYIHSKDTVIHIHAFLSRNKTRVKKKEDDWGMVYMIVEYYSVLSIKHTHILGDNKQLSVIILTKSLTRLGE